jgi:hypothetical protein
MNSRVTCPGRARHWFTLWGMPGYRSPVCVACGAPNPRLMDGEDWAKLTWYRQRIMSGPFRLAALEQAYQEHGRERKA